MTKQHTFPIRVYYEDTDHGGVVYYANYLKFMERGRTEFLRTHGIELDQAQQEYGIMFVVTEVNIRYQGSARFNDMISIESQLSCVTATRITFVQRVICKANLLTDAQVQLACINHTGKACRIPVSLLSILQQHIYKES